MTRVVHLILIGFFGEIITNPRETGTVMMS